MRRIFAGGIAAFFTLGVAACGGGEPGQAEGGMAEDTAAGMEAEGSEMGGAAGALTVPDWMTVDESAQTVTLDITAGSTDANNRWNYNGYYNGNATIVVPEGYEITVNFQNDDPANPHSFGIDDQIGNYPTMYESPEPVFAGAISSGAASMTEATQAGQSETVTFTASEAGEYAMVCYVPAHAATGMWIRFNVSADGQAGVRTQG